MSGNIKLSTLQTELIVKLDEFKEELQKASEIGVSEADKISDRMSDRVESGVKKMSDLGTGLTAGLTTPILAAGTALGKFAADSETQLAALQGQLGLTADETEALRNIAKSVYEDGFGDSMDSCVSDLVVLRQNLRESSDWTADMTENTLKQISTMTTLFDTNADEVTRTLQVMKSSGLIEDVSNGLDIITYGFQNGANYSGEMLDTLREYSPQFVKLGLDGNEAMQYLIQGAENGAFNLDKVGDALKELSIRVVDGSDTTKQGFEAMGKSADEMAQKFAAGGDSAKEAFQETLKGLASIEDPVERNIAGVNLFGTMWEDLGESVILSLSDVEGGLEDIEGATERAGETLNNSFSSRLLSDVRKLKDAFLPLGETLLDLAEDCMPLLESGIEKVTDVLEDMDEEAAQNTLKMAGMAAAAGPVIKVFGSGISTFSKFSSVVSSAAQAVGVSSGTGLLGSIGALSPVLLPATAAIGALSLGVYAFHEQGELMDATILKTTEDMSWMERGLADLQGIEVKTREELENLGLVHKEFSENISPEFQEAVEQSTQELHELSLYLQETTFDDVLTEDEMNAFQSRVEQLCNKAIETINSKKDESVSALAEMFSVDGFIDESEQAVLDYLTSNFDLQVEETNKLKQEIHDIQAAAVAEGRELNEEEIRNIEDKLMRIKQLELESLGATNEEVMYAKNEFAARVKTMELEEASQLLQEKAQLRDEEIVQITAAYDTQIDLLKQKLQEAEGEDARHLQRQIENLTKGKEDQIQLQKDLYDEYVDIVREGSAAAYNEIDEHTGKILTNEEKHSREILEFYKSRYEGINEITSSGTYLMKNTVTGAMEAVTVVVDESTGEIVGAFSTAEGEIGATSNDISKDVGQLASDTQNSFSSMVGSVAAYVDQQGNVRDASDNIVGSLENVNIAADGTRTGILNLNGTPVVIKTNAKGVIQEINDVAFALATLDGKESTITIKTQRLESEISLSTQKRNHFNGIDNVPYDGYQATLHKNERVLTAAENAVYSAPEKIDYNKMAAAMKNALKDMTFQVGDREFARLVRSVK